MLLELIQLDTAMHYRNTNCSNVRHSNTEQYTNQSSIVIR